MADSASEAIRKEKATPVQDVWIDDKWLEKETDKIFTVEGFKDKKV